MKKRILFVDDEPQILEGLRHRLRRQRKKWTMAFVEGGLEALERLRAEPFDVIVTDMRMPRMDGAELLRRVQDEFPGVVRIVLSGHAEMETALRAVPVAHQFLNKPCDAGLLENVVQRACSLQALINDEAVRDTIGKIEKLPALPGIYSKLMAALAQDEISVKDVGRILEQDLALSAKLLQIVNSAFFRLPRTIVKIEEAVAYLGFNTIKQVALAVEVFDTEADGGIDAEYLEALQRHSIQVAALASAMFEDRQHKEDAFVAALLHDIGKLLLAMELPELVRRVEASAAVQNKPVHVLEEAMVGVTHAEAGAYLLGLWGLPYGIIEAVANHHAPDRVEEEEFGILGAVHIADALAHEVVEANRDGGEPVEGRLDEAYVEAMGQTERLASWRTMAIEQAGVLADDEASSGESEGR